MSRPRNLSRHTSAALFASVLTAGAMTVTGAAATASAAPSTPDTPQATPAEALGSHDAKLLAQAEATARSLDAAPSPSAPSTDPSAPQCAGAHL